MTFGILSDWPGTSAYHNEILRGIEDYCRPAGINVMTLAVGRYGSDLPFEKGRYILYEFLKEDVFNGLIAFTASVGILQGARPYLEGVTRLTRKPVISLTVPVEGYPSVIVNNRSGFSDLCRHLIVDHKFRDIVFIAGPRDNYDSNIRLQVLKAEMARKKLELPEERIWFGDFTARSGSEAVRHFSEILENPPRAIVCANDYMAIGAWEEAKNLGWFLPLDTAVTGFDNIEMSHWFELPFTTVRQPFYQQGYESANLLNDILIGRQVPPVTEIPTKMVRRESCGCLFRETEAGKPSPADKTSVIRIIHGERFEEAYQRFVKDKPGDPLIRAWNAFVNETRVMDLKEAEVRRFFNELSESFCIRPLNNEKKAELGKTLLRMQQILADYYKEADLFGKALEGGTFEQAMQGIDNFTQWLMTTGEPKTQSGRLKDLFSSLEINNAWLILYSVPEDPFSGEGICAFSMTDGELRLTQGEEARFPLKEILPSCPFMPEWNSLIVEALYEGDDQIGYLVYDYKRWESDTNEMLRRRLSSGLRAVKITRNLTETNENLQEEIRRRRESESKLVKLMEELKNLSLKDELTGLFNRRGFLTIGEQQIKHYLREKKDFLVLYADMDGLKIINDTLGHQEGDLALQTVARILEASFREADIIARLGGDEFTVLLGSASIPHIKIFSERIEKITASMSAGSKKDYRISLSLGFVSASEFPEASLRELLDHADRKLYEMKKIRKHKIFSL